MKITSAILTTLGLCLLTLSCQNEPSANQSLSSTSTTGTTATISKGRPKIASVLTPPTNTLRIRFRGLTAHMLDKTDQRAVVPNVSGHLHQLEFDLSFKKQLETAFPNAVDCNSGPCVVAIDGMAFRVVDGSGNVGGAFAPSTAFTYDVTHLPSVPGAGNGFDKANQNADIWKTPPPKSSIVAGVFNLAGGNGDATRFQCLGAFDGELTYHVFPMDVFVDYPETSGSKLQVFKDGGSAWVDVITLTTATLVTVNNENTSVTGPVHFQHYASLSTMGLSLPANITKESSADCTSGSNDTLGCSNSQWP